MELTLDDYFSNCKKKRSDEKKGKKVVDSLKEKGLDKDFEKDKKNFSKRSRLHRIVSDEDSQDDDKKVRNKKVDVKNSHEIKNEDIKENKLSPKKKKCLLKSSSIQQNELVRPFDGMSIVVTGTFINNSRTEIEDFVKILGGKLTSAISGKTSYLIAGSILEDGRSIEEGSKYRNAKAKEITILNEDQFMEVYLSFKKKEEFEKKLSNENLNFSRTDFNPKTSGILWTNKHKPEFIEDVIGNGEVIKKLCTWLSDWRSVVIDGKKKTLPKASFSPGSRFPQVENVNARAALISGPPGIGKSTVANLIAKKCDYIPIEMNASDDRTKEIIENLSESAIGGFSLSNFAKRSNSNEERSQNDNCGLNTNILLIMDEVDGLGGSDRGGAAALGRLIQKTRWPIICICNDRMSEKIRNLSSKCYDLKFNRPSKVQIIKRMQEIANKEGIQIESNAIELLCESVGNDLRQILNELQLLSLSKVNLRFLDVKYEISNNLKDVQVTLDIFSATKRLLTSSESSHLSINEKIDIFFIDFDLMPLLIQENYISALSGKTSYSNGNPTISNPESISNILNAANLFVEADIYGSKLRTDNEWSLLSEIAVNCAICPFGLNSQISFLIRPEFPKWLGKNSTKNKNKRLLSELMAMITVGTKGNCPTSKGLRLSGYLDLIYYQSISPLLSSKMDTKDAIQQSISILDEYCLNRTHITEHITSLMLKNQNKFYDKVDSKIKSAMTRIVNSTTRSVKVSIQSSEAYRNDLNENTEGENQDENERDEDSKKKSSENLGSLIKVLKKNKDISQEKSKKQRKERKKK